MAWEAAKLAVAGVAVLAAGAAAGWFVVGPVWFTPPPVPALPLVSSSAPAAPKQHPSLSPSHHRPHRHVVVVPQASTAPVTAIPVRSRQPARTVTPAPAFTTPTATQSPAPIPTPTPTPSEPPTASSGPPAATPTPTLPLPGAGSGP